MIDLANQLRFFVKIIMDLAIDKAISIEKEIAIDFFRLLL